MQVQEIPQEREAEAPSVTDALASSDPEVQASALNAALKLLFRLDGLTRKGRTQEQFDRDAALIQMPVGEAVRSEDTWTRTRASGVVNGLVATLEEIARKKQRVTLMIQQLRDEIRAARRQRRKQAFRAVLLLMGLLVLFYFRGSSVFSFWWMIFPLSGFWALDRNQSEQVVNRLSESWDPRAVGILAVVARERDPTLTHRAMQALTNLLPRIRASDAAYIDAEGMQALILLLPDAPETVQLALLQALEQVGDKRAIPAVSELADSPEVRPDIQKAAAECLPALRQRARLVRDSATLLRASAAETPTEAASQLLRPVSGAPVPTDNLLRPAETPSETVLQSPTVAEPPVFSLKTPADDTNVRAGTSLT